MEGELKEVRQSQVQSCVVLTLFRDIWKAGMEIKKLQEKKCLGKGTETGQCEKQPKKPCIEKQIETKIKTRESKEVMPMKEGGS